jgi:hypothetical protein
LSDSAARLEPNRNSDRPTARPSTGWFSCRTERCDERGTIDDRELAALQMTAEALLAMDLRSLERATEAGEVTEICDEKEPHTG